MKVPRKALLMLPGIVLTQRNSGRSTAAFPPPVTIGSCTQPAALTPLKQVSPSQSTCVPGPRCCCAQAATSVRRKPSTTVNHPLRMSRLMGLDRGHERSFAQRPVRACRRGRHRRCTFLVLGHEVEALEPHRQGQLGGVEDGARGDGGLEMAAVALLELSGVQLTAPVMSAVWA